MSICDFCLIRETEGIYCGECLHLMDQLTEIARGSSLSVPEDREHIHNEIKGDQ